MVEQGVSVLCLLLHPETGKGEGPARLVGGGNLVIQQLCGSFISRDARGHGPYAPSVDIGGGMPGQILLSLMCFPLLLPHVPLQHFRVSLAMVSPWEEEGSLGDQDVQAAPGSLLGRSTGKSESSPTPAHSKYPSIPGNQRGANPEPPQLTPHGMPQGSLGTPGCDTAWYPHTFLQLRLCSAWQSCALLKSVCLVS